ncbi:MAG: hypothetical protein JWP44_1229 [Mucilaginibacter sp.]|nr:hypothetical protein [Mucilaginibacter sp.]
MKFVNVASLGAMNGIKVRVNNIGRIIKLYDKFAL